MPAPAPRRGSARVLVVDHHDSYTWNLMHLIASVTGELPDLVQHDQPRAYVAPDTTHVVLSPGPGSPADEADFRLGRRLLAESGLPILGVCLGMQGIVTTFGGRVAPGRPAHGVVSRIDHDGRGVFAGLPAGFAAVRYHSLVAIELPDCLEVSARAQDGTVMGVRHRDRPIEGVQFHPESILSEHGRPMLANFLRCG
ncbi:aminodeoxychorismate/anthranilate synthase component II [Nocardioides sp.]|jgi:anthranilate synthase/aminodeoxychorismate synthase-like glutamine amidotransferase|uniref:anthranilate synthase component II n=1 Tax=Nocardioides sp. TaxID=35761 RepID=UPI002B5A776C|nr:aminodeoxychorismate/anthranilate synthase component II [Nocardioides sp.]HVX53599.1 aminodeoxychorismate/anthranilate synthase component II [Nocardioides sp.]